MPLYFFDRILGDREELNLPLPARPEVFCSPQTPTQFFKDDGRLGCSVSPGGQLFQKLTYPGVFLFFLGYGPVTVRSSRQPNWPNPLHIYLLPLLTFRYNIAAPPALFPRSLSPSLNTGEREQGLSKVKERHGFLQVNLFKRMNKATVFYATGQEENFADGFFPGFQSGAGISFEEMDFSC
ncbi:hypothetical protein OIU84_021066 [Salix udensis]|uniref:Uncharacterized protein n=1 Tax=Salix udensis TaxID=889485 RepID=A0AAD6KVW4_9ROSI|nr:hypothetical protein OIU84_021066 [Salix udensis]